MITLLNVDGTPVAVEAQVAAPAQQADAVKNVTEQKDKASEQQEQQQQPQGGGYGFWIMIIAMIAIMYFFMWRPEKKRRKEMQQFRDGLKAGDKVITAGGIYAVVKKVEETSLLIEVDSNVTLRIDKNMVIAAPEK